MIFIDSNILAYAFYENENIKRCQELIKTGGITDTINLIEAYNIIESEVNEEYAIKSITSLLKSNLVIVEVNINYVFEALKRRSKYRKLKFLDLVHYVTALLHECDEIASFDRDFDGLELKRIN
ncbi:type II toxin-antitoxin system VapC family toxin [Candidatus Woesearchaeota archaeon]|nr:type II toxin-antitoxin system VapC family toxin [Candidatus Woesearchaeota archaeon]